MERFTQRELKRLAAIGAAIDVTSAHDRKDVPESLTQIGYSAGVNGCNGMLLRGDSGRLYVITKRTPALWLFG